MFPTIIHRQKVKFHSMTLLSIQSHHSWQPFNKQMLLEKTFIFDNG